MAVGIYQNSMLPSHAVPPEVLPMKKLISIITPVYNEEENVLDCYSAVKELFTRDLAEYDYEHIFSDNGSSDNTLKILRTLAGENPRVKVIANARNFGPFRSMFNAVLSASGDAVLVFLPADLQDPPELIVDFVRYWEQGYQVVYGIRKTREENRMVTFLRKFYYRLVNRFADFYVPPDVGEFQLVDKVVIEALKECDDYYPYIRGMIASFGFKSMGLEYYMKARAKGFSKNKVYHLFDQALNGIISTSNVPLRLCLLAGLAISILSIVYSFINLGINLVYYRKLVPPGIATLIVALFFFSGVQLFFIGLLGEYMGAIHFQVRKRPMVIEKERINF